MELCEAVSERVGSLRAFFVRGVVAAVPPPRGELPGPQVVSIQSDREMHVVYNDLRTHFQRLQFPDGKIKYGFYEGEPKHKPKKVRPPAISLLSSNAAP